jgi:hypothetical protein
MNRWALPIVGIDAGQEPLHQLLGGQGAGGESGIQVGNGRLVEIERSGRVRRRGLQERERDEEREQEAMERGAHGRTR